MPKDVQSHRAKDAASEIQIESVRQGQSVSQAGEEGGSQAAPNDAAPAG